MPATEFVTQFDAEPEFWQFLNGLTHEDIITELVQNDLDENSTETKITFDSDSFSCEGNGKSIDEDGWKRLSFIRGAGHQAPRKRFRIGVKNHGLKTCFTLGDEIILRSAGKTCKQTLYSDGEDAAPRPGAHPRPVADPHPRLVGCQVRVPYRTKVLFTSVGEPFEFAVPTTGAIEKIFERACEEIPSRFMGVLRPGIRERYTIVLSHCARGSITYKFRCSNKRRFRGGWLFTRTCTISGNISNLPPVFREGVFDFVASVPNSAHEIPDFYKARNGFHAEVAWRVNTKGVPIPSEGHLRYPIAYTGANFSALTGLSVHYSGPLISDQERHGTTDTPFNSTVIEACDDALMDVLRYHLLPRYGPQSLELLTNQARPSPDRLRSMTEKLLLKRVIPLARNTRSKRQFGPQKGEDGEIRPVVVSSYTWAPQKIEPLLQFLCPQELDQIDPHIPNEIVALLADSDFPGWSATHVTFNENDVLERMQPAHQKPYFKWNSEQEWQRRLGDNKFSYRCLDVLAAICDKKEIAAQEIHGLRARIFLPDGKGIPRPMHTLFVGNEMPPALGILGIPPLLNKEIAAHPLLRRRPWRLQAYSLSTFLESADLNAHSDALRQTFLDWLRKNKTQIPTQFRSRLASWKIWPDRNGSLHVFEDLCLPRNSKIAGILANSVHLPSVELVQLVTGRSGTGIPAAIRSTPSPTELASFYETQTEGFPLDRALTGEEFVRWRQLEKNLATLVRDKQIREWLHARESLGLARDRVLRAVGVLHREVPAVLQVALLDRYLMDRTEPVLDKIFPPQTEPTLDSIVGTLSEDPSRTDRLIPRLKALDSALAMAGSSDKPVKNIACIPYENSLAEPATLAFKGNRGDYWGEWKFCLSGKGLSADEQRYYRLAGVTSGEPDAASSLAFFKWLNEQPESLVRRHLESVIRHFGNVRSVRSWWDTYDDLPCLPVEIGPSLRLVSRIDTLRRGNQVFVPDFEQLADVIRADVSNRQISLAVISHPRVAEPISELLRESSVQSLRAAAAAPVSVSGSAPAAAPSDLEEVFQELRSSKMSNLRKRLSVLEFPLAHLREDWKSRIDKVSRLIVAEQVNACFKIGRRFYSIEVTNGFDEASRAIWLKRDVDPNEALFDALVQRIFKEDVPRFASAVLQTAVRWEYREASFPLSVTFEPYDTPDDSVGELLETEPGETLQTHRPATPNPARNIPHPGPIPQTPKLRVPRMPQVFPGRSKDNGGSLPTNDLEATQIEDLKENQYAWHCQVCLAEKTPGELAPEGSYVALAENRKLIMEAEHADQKHAGGARNAGNLILLCHFHHHQLGNALSRDLITDGLRESSITKQIEFGSGTTDKKDLQVLEGHVVSVCAPALDVIVKFFFTLAHRDYWLATAPQSLALKQAVDQPD